MAPFLLFLWTARFSHNSLLLRLQPLSIRLSVTRWDCWTYYSTTTAPQTPNPLTCWVHTRFLQLQFFVFIIAFKYLFMFALDYWVGPCGTTYGTDAIACQLYYNTANLKKKKKNTQQENKRRKKERTEFQTKDHTRKCKIRCSREEHEREYLS